MRISLIVFLLVPCLTRAEDLKPTPPVDVARDFVKTFCIDCHNDGNQEGKTNLSSFLRKGTFERDALLSVYDQLDLGQMPPEDADQPSDVARARMLAFLSQTIIASGATTIDKKSLRATAITWITERSSRRTLSTESLHLLRVYGLQPGKFLRTRQSNRGA